MPKWTKEQELAINESGKNIIVSAGAGSGKTAVLTERVIRKLKNGTSIKNMLILTFTNNAAHEMKERIRKSIKKESQNDTRLKAELDYIDNAYITTFDSFSLSIVKKYHYILGIGNDIGIIDSSIVDLKRDELLDKIFENKYENNDNNFLELVNLLCVKDDKNLKTLILDVNKKMDLLEDKTQFLDNYLDNYFSETFINSIFNDYEQLLLDKVNDIKNLLNDLENEVDSKYIESCNEALNGLINSTNYESIRNNSLVKLGILGDSTELGKEIKNEITKIIKKINNMCYYNETELKNKLKSTKKYASTILDIIRELDIELKDFKSSINKYEFNDISIMAINIIKNYSDIKNEIRNSFNEICVDEYQDTNDLQESFINLISNNNVYMVGDIKQSIYRFRNANPILFKNKYDKYSKLNGGMKIDLVKNFRSRNEVIENINNIFNLIMDNNIGGAEYHESHNMIFGNTTYINEGKTQQNYALDIYNYNYDKDITYKKEEIEAFIIANDIKNKIKNGYKVFDKDTLILRNANYNDFVILMDRATNFDIYKKIFLYLGIPTTLYVDENILNENELFIIKNIINLIIKIKKEEYDIDFKYSFISIARSYLIRLNDNEIFDIFTTNSFKENDIFKKCYEISIDIDNLNNTKLLDLIVDKFDFINKTITVGNVENKISILDYLYNNFNELDSIGYGIYKLNDYLDLVIKNNKEIKINMTDSKNNAVRIMTIHKSKGLEYNICYFSGFDKPFNLRDLSAKILFDNKYGLVIPIENEGLEELVTKDIIKNNYIKDDISERIRLLYVALTRAKEKMIIVGNFDECNNYALEENGVIENRIRFKYKSFKDIILSIRDYLNNCIVDIDLNTIDLTHDYNQVKNYNLDNMIKKNNEKIEINNINIKKEELVNNHFSKDNLNIIDDDINNTMRFGTHLHELFECIDFCNPDFSQLSDTEISYINNFLRQPLLSNINNAKIYKEYEFIYESEDEKLYGIVDLIIEYSDHIDIIDYKLKNITSEDYIKQLNGYKRYIESTFNKPTNIYLYSILNNKITSI